MLPGPQKEPSPRIRATARHGALAGLIALSLTAAVAVSASPAAGHSGRPAEEPPKTPALRLTVTPRNGFRPFTVTLSGHLSGVAANDEQFCHPGVEWESRTPAGLVVTSKEDPKCLHPPEQIEVPTEFTKVVTLWEPGTYVYRLILYRRDGGKVISNSQEVRVLETN